MIELEAARKDNQKVRAIIAAERKRNISTENALLRYIASLEQQVADLRSLYMSTLQIPVGGKQ